MKTRNGDEVTKIVRQLSKAAIGQLPWTVVLETLRVRFDAVTVALNTLLPTGSSCGGIVGVDQATFEEYACQWAEHDPSRIAIAAVAMEPGSLARTHEVPDFDRVTMRHDIYPGWMRPREFRHGAWLTAWSGEHGMSGLAIYRSPTMGVIDDDLAGLLEDIAQDFIASLRVHHRLQAALNVQRDVEDIMESRGGVVVKLDSAGKVVALSDRARWFIATCGALTWGDSPLRLVAAAPGVRTEFERIVHDALNRDRSALLALPALGRTLPYELMVVPTTGPIDARIAQTTGALLVIADPAAERDLSAQGLRSIYGFTTAEAELARGLARGFNLQEIAELQQISKATVRTQLRGLFTKTETTRQADLVRLLAGSLASVRALLPGEPWLVPGT